MAFNLHSFHRPCDIGFHIEVRHPTGDFENGTFRYGDGSMAPRDATRGADDQAICDHLVNSSTHPGPFISMYTNWITALKIRQWYVDHGAADVVIAAVWLKGRQWVFDAYAIAGALGVPRRGSHRHEVLVWGGIPVQDHRLLAMFGGLGQHRNAVVSLDGLHIPVLLPSGFVDGVQEETEVAGKRRPNATSKLRDELFICTGTTDDEKFCRLVRAIHHTTLST